MDMQQKSLEINKCFEDVYDGIVPKRVPISIGMDNAAALDLAGMDLRIDQFNPDKLLEAMDFVNQKFDTDTLIGMGSRLPALYKTLDANNYKMAEDGYVQHPNVYGIEASEYDELIADPVKVSWEKVLPRYYNGLNGDPAKVSSTLLKAYIVQQATMKKLGPGAKNIAAKHGKYTAKYTIRRSRAPFDLLADVYRSFTGSLSDIRRYPDKALAAVEALKPLSLKMAGAPAKVSSKRNRVAFSLHMAMFMRNSDMEKFWWPSFIEVVKYLDSLGYGINLFCEDDWTRYVDFLQELPQGTRIQFEYGEAKTFKDKLGDLLIIEGLYPVRLLKEGTKQEVVDKAKEIMDILAPGGGYIFNFDKSILRGSDIVEENLHALIETIKEYGKY